MLDWSTISPALVSLFSGLAFDSQPPRFQAEWEGRPKSLTHPGTKTDLVLKVRSIQDIGEDETRVIDVEGTPTLAQEGNRRVILEVRIESLENTDAMWSWTTIERIRSRLRRPSSLAALDAINFALVSTGPSIPVPTTRDRRQWSVASFDVTFGTRFRDFDSEAFNWIASVEVTSKLKGEDAVLAPTPPNYTEIIGP